MKFELRKSKTGGSPSSGVRSCGKPQQNAEGAGVHCGRKVPTSSPVTEVKRDQNAGACIAVVKKQNAGNVLPLTLKHENKIAESRK